MSNKKELVNLVIASLLNDSDEWVFDNFSDGSYHKLNNEIANISLKFNNDWFSYGWRLAGIPIRNEQELPEIRLGFIRYNKLWRIIRKMKKKSDGGDKESCINKYILRISKMKEL